MLREIEIAWSGFDSDGVASGSELSAWPGVTFGAFRNPGFLVIDLTAAPIIVVLVVVFLEDDDLSPRRVCSSVLSRAFRFATTRSKSPGMALTL